MGFEIALFGGSFDPPHQGHKDIINALLKLKRLDLIIILPAFLNPLKNPPMLSFEDRLARLGDMLGENERICISDYEMRHKITHSIDSIRHFKEIYKPDSTHFVIGADIIYDLHKWHKIDEINREVDWIIARRGGIDIESSEFYTRDTIILDIDNDISSSALKKQYFANFKDC